MKKASSFLRARWLPFDAPFGALFGAETISETTTLAATEASTVAGTSTSETHDATTPGILAAMLCTAVMVWRGLVEKKIKQMLRQKHECSHTVWYRTLFQIHFYAFQVSTIQFQVSPILFWVVPILFRVSPILFQVSLILPQVSPILFQVSKHHSNQKQPKPSWRHIKNNAKHIIHINHCKPEQSCDRQTYCLQPTLWH